MNACSLPDSDSERVHAGAVGDVENKATQAAEEKGELEKIERAQEDKSNNFNAWWRQIELQTPSQIALVTRESVGAEGICWIVVITIHNKQINALIDSGANLSFIALDLVRKLQLERQVLSKGLVFQGINKEPFILREYVKGLKWCVNKYKCSWDFLVVPIPYRVILGADWLATEVSTWDIRECLLYVGREGALQTIVCRSQCEEKINKQREIEREFRGQEDKDAAKLAHQRMVDAVKGMGTKGADILVRPSPKHYKCYKNKAKLIPIKEILRCAKQRQSEGANAACVYPSLIEIDTNLALQDQELKFQALQTDDQAKSQASSEEIDDSRAVAGECGESECAQANSNMPCMHDIKPEVHQSPKNGKEEQQQLTAALAIASKNESGPTYEQFDR